MNKRNSGITLVALVITIIVLLIMAGVSIALVVGDNGVLSKAKEAKTGSIVAEEKEQVNLAYSSALTKNLGNTVTAENLQTELNESVGSGKTTVTVNGNNITVLFNETGNTYNLNNGRITDSNGGTSSSGLSDAQILKEFYIANNYTAIEVEETLYEVENEKVRFLINDDDVNHYFGYVLYKKGIFKVECDMEEPWAVKDVEFVETIANLDLTSPGIREYEISVGNGSILVTPSTPEYLVHGIYGITTAEDCYFRTSDNSQFIGGYWTQDRGEHFYETTGEVVEIETTKD